MSEKVMSEKEINELIILAKKGDNKAWESLTLEYTDYIKRLARKKLDNLNLSSRKEIEKDLFQVGWMGFADAVKRYTPGGASLKTYAWYDINGRMNKQLDFVLNPLGIPREVRQEDTDKNIERHYLDGDDEILLDEKSSKEFCERYYADEESSDDFSLEAQEQPGNYSPERVTLQMLETLKIMTDDEHKVSTEEFRRLLRLYRTARHKNSGELKGDRTINKNLAEIISELNPSVYSDDNSSKYRIKYDGYKENYLSDKLKMRKDNPLVIDPNSAPTLSGLSYVHLFDNKELDELIEIICLTDILSEDEKNTLVNKVIGTASVHYSTPFSDGEHMLFNPRSIHGRFCGRDDGDRGKLSDNLRLIQEAINNLGKISFRFNRYTEEHEMVPASYHIHRLSPYHLVVYHDNYYCIGLKDGDSRIWHYRVDLMSDIQIIRNDEGEIIPINLSDFDGLPIANSSWNPQHYMSEHLNMAYDSPARVFLKIKKNDYTFIHDWFGDNYKKLDKVPDIVEGVQLDISKYDIVEVVTSPSMIVYWALQYAEKVEVLNEDIREKMRKTIRGLDKKYD